MFFNILNSIYAENNIISLVNQTSIKQRFIQINRVSVDAQYLFFTLMKCYTCGDLGMCIRAMIGKNNQTQSQQEL